MNIDEIAADLRQSGYPTDAKGLAKLILRFVEIERERCAKIAEQYERDPELGETGTCSQMIRQTQ